jgi:hypothetical protein
MKGRFSFKGGFMNIFGIILIAILIFVLIFVFLRLLTIVKNKTSVDEMSVPLKYIKNKYKLNIRERRSKRLRLYIDLVNTIAITIPIYIVLFIDLNNILKYGGSLILFIFLIIGGYNLIGNIEKGKDEK